MLNNRVDEFEAGIVATGVENELTERQKLIVKIVVYIQFKDC